MSQEDAVVLHENWTAVPSHLSPLRSLGRSLRDLNITTTTSAALSAPIGGIPSTDPIPAMQTMGAELRKERQAFHESRRSDARKGCEQYGRILAMRYSQGWEEYWDFLDCL